MNLRFLFLSFAFGSFLLLSVTESFSQNAQDIARCEGKENPSPDLQIQSCTALIKSGRLNEKQMATAYWLRAKTKLYSKKDYSKKLDEIIQDYSESIRRDPTRAKAFYGRADAYKIKAASAPANDGKRWAALAVQDFSENIRLESDPKPLDYINRSNAYDQVGEYEKALADLTQAIRLDPSDKKEALVNRCTLLGKLGRWLEALSDCNESLGRHGQPGQPADRRSDSLFARGEVYLRMKKYMEANADFDTALSDPALRSGYDRARVLAGRGIAKIKAGDETGAADIEASKKLDADVAKRLLKELN